MKEQFGTVDVREARLSRKDVEQLVHETLFHRGPDSYNYDYGNPIFVWQRDGGLTVRWITDNMRAEDGRHPSALNLMPLAEFVKRTAARMESDKARAEAERARLREADAKGEEP